MPGAGGGFSARFDFPVFPPLPVLLSFYFAFPLFPLRLRFFPPVGTMVETPYIAD